MFDPQVLALTLGAWALGVFVGGVGALRHVRRCPSAAAVIPPALRAITPPTAAAVVPPGLSPRPVPRALSENALPMGGRVLARGICMICARPWGICTHTRNG